MFGHHVLDHHTPMDVYFNIDGEFYYANQFRVHHVTSLFHHQANGIFPAYYPEPGTIFVVLPVDIPNRVYRARVTHHTITGEDHLHSGTAHVFNMLP